MADRSGLPFGQLTYLYVGVKDFEKTLAHWRDVLGARVVWNHEGFGAHVAAVRAGEGPLVLLADHRPAPSCMPIFVVKDLEASVKTLKDRGWKPLAGPVDVPDGPCYTFEDPSGNPVAILEQVRPDALGSG